MDDRPPAVLTVRSVLLGLFGVCFVCGLTAYNDFAMGNTLLIGNFLPIGLLLVLLALVLGVNVPLRRLLPRLALRQGELAFVTLMVLVACSVPSSGLMRYLPGGIVGVLGLSADRPGDYGAAVDAVGMPEWVWPTTGGDTAADRGNSPVIYRFRARAPDGQVPWAAWVRPFFTWGVLVACLWGLLVGLSLIVRRQWFENERLGFPLATVYGALIEEPTPGRLLNPLFGDKKFWVAAGTVFAVRGLNALAAYDPSFPRIPLGYDLRAILADVPWEYTGVSFKTADLYFAVIGIAFFIQTKTAFSLWACFLGWQVLEMTLGTAQVPLTENMRLDQTFGAVVAFAAVVVYLGRRHWATVLRHMIGRRRAGEQDGAYLPYSVTGWFTVLCLAGVVAWLAAVGMTIVGAIVVAVSLATMFLVVARVMADTGLFFVQLNVSLNREFYYPVLVPPTPHYPTPGDFFVAGWMTHLFHDLRESLAAFFQLGLKTADEGVGVRDRPRRVAHGLLAAVALSLGVAYTVSWAAMLTVEYRYAQTVGSNAGPVNEYGTQNAVTKNVLDPQLAYQSRSLEQESKTPFASPLLHAGLGAAAVGLCGWLRATVPWWPLHPVGFVVVYSYAMQKIWFSVMVGWVAKAIVVRFGGASLLRAGRGVFLGLVLGDAVAAAFWLVVNIVMNAAGYAYKPLQFLPG